uniref:ACB domain-containing protein n=1 Tax=Zea mays TaxID=4577 RepID=C0HFV6_MAIZE|nr:unknown [Zea mays]
MIIYCFLRSAWQKLGNMNPEIAMEKYMNLLSETIPGWMMNETLDTENTGSLPAETILTTMASTSDQRSNQGNEDNSSIGEGHPITSPNPEKGQSSDIPTE